MKKQNRLLSLFILPTIIIAACSCSLQQSPEEKAVNIYDLDIIAKSNKHNGYVNETNVMFIHGQEYIPYLSLKQYAALYEPHFDNGVRSTVSSRGNLITWTIYTNEGLVFISQIDTENKTVLSAGSIQAALKADDSPVDTRALSFGMVTDYDGEYLGQSIYATYSYADIDLKTVTSFGNTYFPLGFLDITYSGASSIYFYYNYLNIYSAHSIESYYTTTFQNDGNTLTVNKEMAIYRNTKQMPDYLKNYNVGMFMYLMDNFYGLKDYKGVKSTKEYCEEIGTYSKLFSDNDQERVQAYADTLSKLDDNHTGLVAGNEAWGEQTFNIRNYGDGCKARGELNATLTIARMNKMDESYYAQNNEPVFSSDGKTAMYYFNSFVFGTSEQVFASNGSIKSDAWQYDSFIALARLFNNLKNKGGVENVILDMSTNGGGVLGVLMKLLALISKDNIGNLYYLEASNQQVGIANIRVDFEGNNLFNNEDCFGDDFNIYLLTSDCSFSCGNAFPCLAQYAKTAKVIGKKSGGGECAVGMHCLPNGEYVYHSSSLHLGYFNQETKEFIGFESGAQPDIVVNDYDDFFNVDRLASYISNQ